MDAMDAPATPLNTHPARWWRRLDDGRILCELCPRACKLHEGQRAACFVRMRQDDRMWLTSYGRNSGMALDPIEKKPLNHFLPGSRVLSFGTAGCNLACRFCQNWEISQARATERLQHDASPEGVAAAALRSGARSVAFTYNDPVIFAEYAIDTARACRERGVHTVAVTAGYINPPAAREFFGAMDAANVDLKAFTDAFYQQQCAAHLTPVLDTLAWIRHETNCWLEITTLLIPGLNDGDAELRELAAWVARELGPDVPLHFSAFHPDNRMRDVPATPPATLQRARRIARDAGLHHVYTGNVHDPEGQTTWCASCGEALIRRDWHRVLGHALLASGACRHCGTPLAGRFDGVPVTA